MKPLLDLELLNTFTVVVAEGGFKDAAARLFRSQAAVSMQIKRLEEQAGACLLQRSNQGISLTTAGSTLLRYAEQFQRLNNEALSALSDSPLRGRVHFGVPTDYAQAFLQHFIPRLRVSFPELQPRVTCARSRALRDMVKRSELDIAIVTGEPRFPQEEVLWTERLQWSAAAGLAPEPGSPLPVALFTGDCILRELSLNDLKQAGISHDPVMTSTDLENICAAVNSGLAAALLPESSLVACTTPLQGVDGLPRHHVFSMNLVYAPTLESSFHTPLANCMRETAQSVMKLEN
ncbi:LysR family transcriptional regulator [Oceanimonas doudoroffii]|uniref:HTH lysR-type domain-containing protein n=1 Tax=Oceanimonas doudoroffii TaxID=84158 RepID=A0A233RIF2_9GAMM|nr:LysR family transcriptional regulator [Oceanimonas doudoroffii]OXY83175.1 hypothetical protein B6S08_06670 [Oceanimonas doudoroffii]